VSSNNCDSSEMVSLIPRAASIAVSGTPARSKVSDLSHVLKSVPGSPLSVTTHIRHSHSIRFLRVEQAVGSSRTWDRLLKPEFKDLFTDLFRTYAIRTLKKTLQSELTIPPQRRFAVGIELGRVEQHVGTRLDICRTSHVQSNRSTTRRYRKPWMILALTPVE
jgi:E3 ubiquitin-protein ligase SHPRH